MLEAGFLWEAESLSEVHLASGVAHSWEELVEERLVDMVAVGLVLSLAFLRKISFHPCHPASPSALVCIILPDIFCC